MDKWFILVLKKTPTNIKNLIFIIIYCKFLKFHFISQHSNGFNTHGSYMSWGEKSYKYYNKDLAKALNLVKSAHLNYFPFEIVKSSYVIKS